MADFGAVAMTTCVVAAGSAEAARIHAGKAPTMSPVLGGFILGVFLFAFGMVSEYLASLFCYLIIIGSLLINGGSLFALATPKK